MMRYADMEKNKAWAEGPYDAGTSLSIEQVRDTSTNPCEAEYCGLCRSAQISINLK